MTAVYVRQSMDKKDSISIETQIEFCKKEFDSENESYKIYSDKGFSGKNIDRPEFSELLDSISRNQITKVVVYRIDRISRSITDFANIMNLFEENGVSFVSSTEKFDTSTPMGRAMLYIVMVFAQLERETLAERIRDNYYSRGKNGVFLGGPPPLGFVNTTAKFNGKNIKTLTPNEDIKIVQNLFDIYANSGRSLGDIAKEFQKLYGNNYGVWNNIKLSRILHNPVYVKANADIYKHYSLKNCIMVNDIEEFAGENACYVFGKRDRNKNKYRNLEEHVVVLAQHEGIIEPDTFLRCHYKLDRNQQIKNTGKGKHTWLTGLVKCGYCNHGLVIKNYGGKVKYLYCSGRQNNLCDPAHKTHHLHMAEKFVDDEISNLLKNSVSSTLPEKASDTNQDNLLKIELYRIEEQIGNLINSLANSNEVLTEYVNKKIIELDLRKKQLQEDIQKTAYQEPSLPLPDLEDWKNGDMEAKRQIAFSLINKIIVGDSEIKIQWKH